MHVTNHSIHDLGKSKEKGRTMKAFLEGTLESSGSFKNEVTKMKCPCLTLRYFYLLGFSSLQR